MWRKRVQRIGRRPYSCPLRAASRLRSACRGTQTSAGVNRRGQGRDEFPRTVELATEYSTSHTSFRLRPANRCPRKASAEPTSPNVSASVSIEAPAQAILADHRQISRPKDRSRILLQTKKSTSLFCRSAVQHCVAMTTRVRAHLRNGRPVRAHTRRSRGGTSFQSLVVPENRRG